MDATPLLRPLLNRLGREIEHWRPPQAAPDESVSFAQKVKLLAVKLQITEKTLNTWLSKPDPAMSLSKFLELCLELGVRPHTLIPGAPQLHAYSEVADPVESEQALLNLEQATVPGARVAAMFPLWPASLLLDPLLRIYAEKGLYRRYRVEEQDRRAFNSTDRLNRTLELRRQRRMHFFSGHYLLKLVFMRDELEQWVNGERLFKRQTIEDRIQQLDYLIDLLQKAVWNGTPRLQLRLSSAYFRAHYSFYEQPDGTDITILDTNSGYVRLQDAETQALLRQEFAALWEENSEEGLRTSEEWVRFFVQLKQELDARKKSDPKKNARIDVKAILEAPISARK